jgi:UDP-sugar transporter A1/2/3
VIRSTLVCVLAQTYQILGNLKIVVVAIVQRGMLRSTKTLVQWLGVTLLMLGMMVIASGKLSATSVGTAMEQEQAKSDLFLGLFFMVLISLASAFAGVYTEFLLKRVDYSTDFQNILLYAWGVVFCLLGHVFQPASLGHGGDGSFFGGFEAKVWLVVVINAFLGQVVSRVMKYADNITKVFASSSGVIITAILSRYLFAFELTLPFCLGTTVRGRPLAAYKCGIAANHARPCVVLVVWPNRWWWWLACSISWSSTCSPSSTSSRQSPNITAITMEIYF